MHEVGSLWDVLKAMGMAATSTAVAGLCFYLLQRRQSGYNYRLESQKAEHRQALELQSVQHMYELEKQRASHRQTLELQRAEHAYQLERQRADRESRSQDERSLSLLRLLRHAHNRLERLEQGDQRTASQVTQSPRQAMVHSLELERASGRRIQGRFRQPKRETSNHPKLFDGTTIN